MSAATEVKEAKLHMVLCAKLRNMYFVPQTMVSY